jgi:membrane-associated phospholipid phosphatase
MAVASWPGFPPQSRVIPPLVTAAWWVSGQRRAAAYQGAGWGGAFLSTVVKLFVRRPRPSPADVHVVPARLDGTSFPSGHVLAYTTFYGFLIRLLEIHIHPGMLRRILQGSLMTMLAFVGLSRVQRGHHWASDVLASYLLGSAYVAWLACLYDRVRSR